jgi:hypothetical protein
MYVRKSAPAICPALPVPVSLLSVLAAFKVNATRRMPEQAGIPRAEQKPIPVAGVLQ